jgi:gliding motility-associated-like protein
MKCAFNLHFLLALIALLLGFNTVQSQDYRGTDFRFAFLDNLDLTFNLPPVFYISGFAIEDADIEITYSVPGEPLYSTHSLSVNAGESFVHVYDDDDILYQQTFNTPELTSFHVTATGNIRLYATHFRLYFSEASAILPTEQLGNEYTNLSQEYLGSSFGIQPSLFSIVGVQDNTEVHYIPSADAIGAIPAGSEQSVVVNAGEVVSIGSLEDLTGSRIFTPNGEPFAVFTGHKHTLVTCGGADSHLYEQLLPKTYWSDYYPIIPSGGEGNDALRIIVAQDSTDIFSGCDYVTTLNVGDIYETNVAEPAIYHGTGPFLPALFTIGNDCSPLNTGDPNMRIPLPLNRANSFLSFETPFELDDYNGTFTEYYFLHLVTNASNSASVLVNGNTVNNWNVFDGMDDMVYAVIDVEQSQIDIEVTADGPFWGEYVAMSNYDVISLSLGADTSMNYTPIITLNVDLGPDIQLCPGDSILLDTGVDEDGIWQDGTVSNTYLVTEPGTYSVSYNATCGSASGSVQVNAASISNLTLADEYFGCDGDPVLLSSSASSTDEVLWSNGDTVADILVSIAGVYNVSATSIDGCIALDTTQVFIGSIPEFVIQGPEFLCQGDSVLLEVIGDSGVIEWSTGENESSVWINSAGEYSVVVTNEENCSDVAFIDIGQENAPFLIIEDSVFCNGNTLTYAPEFAFGNVSWPGYSETDSIEVTEGGIYEIRVENLCGEISQMVSLQTEDCTCLKVLPNIITPDGDGKNDVLTIPLECEGGVFQLYVFNRWGTEIFQTDDINEQWNGGVNNDISKGAPAGVYSVLVNFVNPFLDNSKMETLSGTVTLVR